MTFNWKVLCTEGDTLTSVCSEKLQKSLQWAEKQYDVWFGSTVKEQNCLDEQRGNNLCLQNVFLVARDVTGRVFEQQILLVAAAESQVINKWEKNSS